MSGADPALAMLVAEFRTLGDADRRAILARLRFDERLRFETAARSVADDGGYSPDVATLVETGGAGLTVAAQAALVHALAAGPTVTAPPCRPTLFDRLRRR